MIDQRKGLRRAADIAFSKIEVDYYARIHSMTEFLELLDWWKRCYNEPRGPSRRKSDAINWMIK